MNIPNYTLSVEPKSIEHYKFICDQFDAHIDMDGKWYMDNPCSYIITVRINNENELPFIIAISSFRIFDDSVNVDYVAIDREYRKMGINSSINNLIENISASNYIDYLTANIRGKNINSINSFLKCGFIIDENRKVKYSNGDDKVHVYKKITI